MEKMQQGPITGSHVRDIRVSVFDGKMHAVDSNDLAFKLAGMMAFKQAFQQADPQLLEPIYHVDIRCPDELTGNIMGDVQMRRGMVEGVDTEGHFTVVKAKIPYAEMQNFASSLRSITQGRARFCMRFDHYAPVSSELQKKLSMIYNNELQEEEA